MKSIENKPVVILPTAWQQFYLSGFKYRPCKNIKWNRRPSYKTNKAKWAKQ